MIDVYDENLMTLSQAAKSLPGRPSAVTLYRWSKHGKRGVILETIDTHQGMCTTPEKLNEFFRTIARRRASRNPRRGMSPADEEAYQTAKAQLDATPGW